jgi:hypothetical protein
MSLNLSQSNQFTIRKLILITKFGNIDIVGVYQEINIYDGMFMPCMRGEIVIRDAIGLTSKLSLDGSEYIQIEISKSDESGPTLFNKTFRIYKQSNRENINLTSEIYILHFASEEMIFSEQKKITQSFNGTYTDIVNVVLDNYLKVSLSKRSLIEKSKGIHSIVIPNLSPLDAIDWLCKRAVNSENLPSFFFFENKYGYNFISLTEIIKQTPITNINFGPKNVLGSNNEEFYGAINAKVNNSTNLISNIKNGLYAGKFIGIDPLTRQIEINKIGISEIYNNTNHLNKYPNVSGALNREGNDASEMYDSKVSLYAYASSRSYSGWITQKDSKTGINIDDTHSYVFQRAPIIGNLLQTTIHLTLPGNFGITSGFVVNLKMPARSFKPEAGKFLDESLTGKYIITAARHIIRNDSHETVIELATDSTNKPLVINETSGMSMAMDN